MPDNRNFLIAIVLSLAVLIGWQFFIAGPQQQKAQQEQQLAQQQAAENAPAPAAGTTPATTVAGGVPPVGTVAGAPLSREAALAETPRVPIATAALSGSISLAGGRLDDLHLNDYHETVDDSSPTIELFSPAQTTIVPADPLHGIEAKGPYYAEFGWIAAPGGSPVPGPDTTGAPNRTRS